MGKEAIISPTMSLKGWTFGQWFLGNWTTIKEAIKVLVPLVIGWWATGNPYLTTLITLAGKLILDTGEYFVKKY